MECKKCAEKDDVIERLRLALNDCDVEITEKAARIAELERELRAFNRPFDDPTGRYDLTNEEWSKQ